MKLVGAALTFQAHPVTATGMLSSVDPKGAGEKNAVVAEQLAEAQGRLDAAWRRLERVAKDYGVSPKR